MAGGHGGRSQGSRRVCLSLSCPPSMASLRRTHPPQKRARSPDHTHDIPPQKRQKAPPKDGDKDKARRHAEREQQRLEFKDKYTRAFPGWKFFIDIDNIHPDNVSNVKHAQAKIRQLGGSIESYPSNTITHLITDAPNFLPSANKENDIPRHKLRSPFTLKAQDTADDDPDPVSKTRTFENTKVWTLEKLTSVLDRCLDPAPTAAAGPAQSSRAALPPQRSLSRLLQSERLHGTTERDPTQKRHDHKYFNRNTYFLLVEDLKEELAPIAVQEYLIPRGRDAATAKVPWPVLYCHPNARGPFTQFDEKEKKRWEKAQRMELEEAGEREAQQQERMRRAMIRKAEAHKQALHQAGDLRRSASMNNMHRRALEDQQFVDLDADADLYDSAQGNVAASGNSVGITSTTGTTSTTGLSMMTSLPAALRGRPQVITSRKSMVARPPNGGDMGPPCCSTAAQEMPQYQYYTPSKTRGRHQAWLLRVVSDQIRRFH
ncbi:DBF4-type domain-containing protein [Mycena kentingensis (nom. inval.)]|nr:DBF4-type domain-containing protein [Mycena kentingensis (nom. inval.)]